MSSTGGRGQTPNQSLENTHHPPVFQLTGQDGQSGLITRIPQGDPRSSSELEVIDILLRDVEGDGHGKEITRGESEGVSDADSRARSARPLQGNDMCEKDLDDSRLIVGLVHKSLERRETSIHDKFQITKLPLSQSNISELL